MLFMALQIYSLFFMSILYPGLYPGIISYQGNGTLSDFQKGRYTEKKRRFLCH